MKLHLPKMLAVALLSACAAISANADVPYTGSVYTWDNTTSGTDPAFGNYALTTYDEQGNPTVTTTVISGRSGNWGNVQAIFASDNINTGNTMRFDSTHGQNVKTLNYTFTPFTVGGFIVEEGATGFTINSSGTYDRAFFLGNKDGSASYNEIHEDFAVNKTSGGLTLTLRGAETFDVAAGKTFTLKSNNTINMSGSMNVLGGGTVNIAQGNVAMASGVTLNVQEDSTLKFAGSVSGLSRTIVNDGTINFGGTVSVADFSGFEGTVVYSDGNNGFVTSAAYTLIKGTGTSNLTAIQHGTSTLAVTDNKVSVDEADYSTYYLNDNGSSMSIATAAAEAESHESVLANIVVKGTGTGITSDKEGGALLNSLSLGAGADTTVSGTELLTVGAVTFGANSKLALAENASVKVLTKPTFTTGTKVTVAEGSVLDLRSYSSNPDAVEAVAASVTGAGTVKITATGELSFSENGTTTVLTALEGFSDAEFNGKGWVAGSYGHIFNIGDGTSAGSIKAAGTLRLESKVHVNVNQGSSLVVDGTLAMGHTQAGNPGHLVVNGGTLTVGHILLQDDTTANTFSLTNATVEVTQAGDVFTGTGAATAVTTSGLLVKNLSDGDITWNHASDYAGGDLAVDANGHTVTLGVAGGLSTLHNTIEVKDGDSIGFAGTWDVSHLAGDAQPTYKDGVSEGNGFASLEIAVQLATGTITEASDDATFIIKGVAGTLDHSTGQVTTTSEPDYTTYFLNHNDEAYSDILDVASQHQELTGGIVVAAGATLQADTNMSMSVLAASSQGSVEINDDVVVTAAGGTQTVSLTGDGTYALASGTQTLGSVNTDDFDGYVRLTGEITDINLDGNLQDQNVELNGVSKYFKNLAEDSNAEFTGDIRLTDADGTAALTINNGYSRKTSTYIFSGDISGEGKWELTNGNITQHYEFQGDLSDWTGEFNISGGRSGNDQDGWHNTSLTFSNEEGTVGAAITRTGGYLDLNINENTTFANTVTNVTNVVVEADKEVTFNAETSIGTLAGEGDVHAEQQLTLTGRTITFGEDDDPVFSGTLSASDLVVSGEVDLGGQLQGENIRVVSGGSLALSVGSQIGDQPILNEGGTVSLSGIDVSDMVSQSGEEARFDLEGHVTWDDNYYMGTTADYVQVVDGGSSAGFVQWQEETYELADNGCITVSDDHVDYDTFYVGGQISTSDINASGHAGSIENINVLDGGTLTVDAVSEVAIHAGDGATVAGDHAQDTVRIRTGETVAYADGIEAAAGSARFTGDVQVTNSAAEAAFSVTSADMEVQANALTYGADATDVLEITCGVDVDTITNQSGQNLILNKLVASELDGVSALSGNIVLASTQDDLTINNLEIQAGQAVQALKGSSGAEITVTVTDTLAAGGNATLLANLEMANDSALLLDGVQQGLSIGSTLTMNTGIQMDEATLRALDAMAIGDTFWLIGAANGTTMDYTGESGEDAWYDGVFSRISYGGDYTLQGDFNIAFSESDGFGLKKFSETPEPTTGTLGLLALAALASRRRRH